MPVKSLRRLAKQTTKKDNLCYGLRLGQPLGKCQGLSINSSHFPKGKRKGNKGRRFMYWKRKVKML